MEDPNGILNLNIKLEYKLPEKQSQWNIISEYLAHTEGSSIM